VTEFLKKKLNLETSLLFLFAFFSGTALFVGNFSSSISQVVLLLLFFLCFFRKQSKVNILECVKPTKSHVFWLLLGVSFFLSILVNLNDYSNSLKIFFKLRYFLLPFILSFILKKTPRDLQKTALKIFSLSALVSFLVVSSAALSGKFFHYNFLRPELLRVERLSGVFRDIMSFGYTLSLCLSLYAAFLLVKYIHKKRIFIYEYIFLVFASGILYLTYCRGAVLGVCAGIFFVLPRKIALWTLLSSFVVLLIYGFGVESKSRYFQAYDSGSNKMRLTQYQVALLAVKERPLLGWGYKNFSYVAKTLKKKYNLPYKNLLSNAHNNFLEAAATGGLISFFLFSGWLFFFFLEIKARTLWEKALFNSFLVSFLVSGLFQCTFMDSESLYVVLLVYGFFLQGPQKNNFFSDLHV